MRARLESGMRRMPPPLPPTGDSPPQFINKDQVLAIEMAEELGAEIPIAKLMENLDESRVYEAYTKFMRGE